MKEEIDCFGKYYGYKDDCVEGCERRKECEGVEIAQLLEEATDELAEALADLDAKISWDEPEAYICMHNHVVQAQIKLLKIMKFYKV